jgi:predicted anti-sigma-YlaC factor YlaD
MTRHLADEALAEALEGRTGAEAQAHLRSCEACGVRLRDAQEALRLAAQAEVPEPSPLYWEAFRRQIGRRIAEEPRVAFRRTWWAWGLAAVAAVVVVVLSGPSRSRMPSVVPTLPAWVALPEEDEASLSVLEGMGPSDEDLRPALADQGVAHEIAELSEEDSRSLAAALEGEWGGKL